MTVEAATKPVLTVIAGPNGSGKTTLTEGAIGHGWLTGCVYINPAAIAQERFGDWNSPDAVLKAAQYAENLRDMCVSDRRSFAFETVISARGKVDFLRKAQAEGFFIRLFFIGTDGPQINASRVARRIMEGGHAVPIGKIVSRYGKSMINLDLALRFVDRGYVYDNSQDFAEQKLLFRTANGYVERTYETREWAEFVREGLPFRR